jgi:hypothetical protein
MNRTLIIIVGVGIGLLLIATVVLAAAVGINRASNPPDTAATLNAFYTSQAMTLQAALTPVAPTGTPFLLTPPTPSGPTITPLPTFTTGPAVPTPTSTPQSICDRIQFVSDVTVPDGALFPADFDFTKTWRLKNVGTCTWTTGYSLVFSSGTQMDGPNSQPLTTTVAPGQSVDIAVRLESPGQAGNFTGNWLLRNQSGQNFGVGDAASNPFWVKIKVETSTVVAYNFAKNACQGVWRSGAGELPCQGTVNDPKGFVVVQENPLREDGARDDETSLLTGPQNVQDGYIQGRFPFMQIARGDRFKAVIDCEYQYDACNVTFRLDYVIEGQDKKTLWHFNEVYEGDYYSATVELSSLAGKNVRFFLVVLANGSPNEDHAQWIAPRIVRLASQTPPD